MSVAAANELIRQIALELELEELDFSDLVTGLTVDLASVTIEYLPGPESFLLYGLVAEGVDMRDNDLLRRIHDFSHASVMLGGGALTLDQARGDIWYSLRLDIEGLTVEKLGERISQVATSATAHGAMISGPSMMNSAASLAPVAIRV